MLVAATLAVLAAAIAPLWSGAAQESLVRTRLTAEPVSATGYTTERTAASAVSAQPVAPVTAEQEVHEEAAGLPAGIDGYFDDPRVMLTTSEIIVARDEVTARGRLVWRENQCDHLAIDGRCPQARDEVVLTRRSAVALGAQVGDVLRVPAFAAESEQAGSGDPFPTLVTVTGVYRPPDAAESYWFDADLFDFSPSAGGLRDPRPAHLDAVFVTQELLHALRTVTIEATAERALEVTNVRVDDLERIDAALDRHVMPNRNAEHVVRQETELPAVISDIADERAFVRTAALLVGVQLLVLAWYALGLVVTTTSDARSGEVALARLRGLPVRATVRHSLAEPLLLLALAVPIGGLLAYVTVGQLAQRFLAPETPVRLGWPVSAAVVLAVAGAVAAIVFSSRRSLRRPVVDQLRRVVPTARLGRVLTGEAIVLSAAAVAVYQLVQLGSRAAESGLGLLAGSDRLHARRQGRRGGSPRRALLGGGKGRLGAHPGPTAVGLAGRHAGPRGAGRGRPADLQGVLMTETSVASAALIADAITVRGPSRPILSDVSCSVGPGEVLAVTGRSGSGKTTLLAVLAGLLAPSAGTVRFAGTTVVPGAAEHLLRTGIVLQLYGLVSVLTAQENVEIALQARGIGGRKVRSQAAHALARMGLTDLSDRLVEQLSGGQRQRVAVARALVATPTLILADEPTAELDAMNRDRVVAELRAEADRGTVVVVATHDPDLAARCDDEVHLADGVVADPT